MVVIHFTYFSVMSAHQIRLQIPVFVVHILFGHLKSGLWDVRQFEKGRWEQLTNDFFDSENAAFNHVYKKYCDEYNLLVINDTDKEYLKKIKFLECY